MSDGTYNRPQRLFDSRGSDSRGADHGASERRGPTSDPLLELARLIGQSDPFAPVRGRADDPPHGGFDSQDRAPVDRAPAERAPFIRPPSRDYASSQDQPYQDRPFPDRPAFLDRPPQDRSFEDHTSQDRYQPDFSRRDAQPAPPPRFPLQPDPPSAPHFAPDNSFFPRPPDRDAFPVAPQQAPAESFAGDDHYADPQAAPYEAAHGQQGDYAGEYDGTEYEQEAEYEYEAEPEEAHQGHVSGPKRRNTTKVVIAVLGLAVFGSAAAFGYRTVFKGGPSGPAPVIRADTSPTKVMPAGGDPNQKPISERLGGAGERVERREEDPVDLSRATAAGVMGGGGPYPGTGFSSSAAAPPSSGPASLTEPKKVRTVTIRAEQGSSAPAAAPPSRGSAQRQAAAVPSNAAPMAITPDAPPARAAAAPPPAPRASDSAAGGGGSYVVQLMAAKSEADAQAAFRAAQAKYSVLSGRQLLIRRKDTDHGVFYAAQVGPFGAKGDAEQLCDTLKSSGGNCWVYRN